MTTPARPYAGIHCETTATGTLLGAIGCSLSEPLLFGLGESLGFIFLNLSTMPLGFLGGRSKPFAVTEAACRNLGVTCTSEETTSVSTAWSRLERPLQEGQPVGLQLDCYYLPYFLDAPHFAGHFVAATRLLADEVEVVDTVQQGSVHRVPRSALQAARHARGPMSAKARSYTISGQVIVDLGEASLAAMRRTADTYLTPDFGGMGALGLAKLAKSLPHWLERSTSPTDDLHLEADLMERAGTGGALFRNLYRDFLDEAAALAPARADAILQARRHIASAAEDWTRIAQLLDECAEDGQAGHLGEAAALCRPIAEAEVAAMQILAGI